MKLMGRVSRSYQGGAVPQAPGPIYRKQCTLFLLHTQFKRCPVSSGRVDAVRNLDKFSSECLGDSECAYRIYSHEQGRTKHDNCMFGERVFLDSSQFWFLQDLGLLSAEVIQWVKGIRCLEIWSFRFPFLKLQPIWTLWTRDNGLSGDLDATNVDYSQHKHQVRSAMETADTRKQVQGYLQRGVSQCHQQQTAWLATTCSSHTT